MMHLSGYYQSVNPGGVATPIAAIFDQVVTTAGNDVRVPDKLNNVMGAVALINDASAAAAQLQAPSLRDVINVNLEPVIPSNLFGSPIPIFMHGDSPIPLDVDENLEFWATSAPAGAVDHYGLVWLGDGPVQPTKGNIYSLLCTAAAPGSTGKWTTVNLAQTQVLPVGDYQVVGMRARGAHLVAARLVFVGGIFRPGVPAVNAIGGLDYEQFRFGNAGVFGAFHSTTPPTVDLLDGTAENCSILLDLIKTG